MMDAQGLVARNFVVMDSSAITAWLKPEEGWDVVERFLPFSIINAVNWAEVVRNTLLWSNEIEVLQQVLEALGVHIIDFTRQQADRAARLIHTTRGLSLADRACLATAFDLSLLTLTTEASWLNFNVGVRVILVDGRRTSPPARSRGRRRPILAQEVQRYSMEILEGLGLENTTENLDKLAALIYRVAASIRSEPPGQLS
jgi:PIN domain nuclease of toxin-antitoxin system